MPVKTISDGPFVKTMLLHARARNVTLGKAGRRVIQLTALSHQAAGSLHFHVALGPIAPGDEEDVRAAIGVMRGVLCINIARSFLRREGSEEAVVGDTELWTLHVVGEK